MVVVAGAVVAVVLVRHRPARIVRGAPVLPESVPGLVAEALHLHLGAGLGLLVQRRFDAVAVEPVEDLHPVAAVRSPSLRSFLYLV